MTVDQAQIDALLAEGADDAALQAMTDEELASYETRLREAFASLDEQPGSPQVVQAQQAIADTVDRVGAEGERRDTEAERLEAEREAARARMNPSEGEEGTEGGESETPQSVAASGGARARAARRAAGAGRLARHRPARNAPEGGDGQTVQVPITAGVNAGQWTTPGQVYSDERAFADVMDKARLHIRRSPGNGGPDDFVYLGSMRKPIPADRMLDRTMSEETVMEKIDAATKGVALTAAGGFCAPFPVNYELPILGDTGRPVRDALAQMGADRGGIRFQKAPIITDLAGAIGIWTSATDASPGGATKPCLRAICNPEQTASVDAVTTCILFGNMTARYAPEMVAANTRLAAINHDRIAENNLLSKIGALSTQVNMGVQTYGASVDLLANLLLFVAGFRSRNRLAQETRLRLVLPFWASYMLRADLARRFSDEPANVYNITDADIEGWIRNAANVNVTWHLDGQASQASVTGPPAFPAVPAQIFGAQAAGDLLTWPDVVVSYLWVEGEMIFLDGGTLDLGLVRDSTLNSTNDYKTFMESFEGVAFRGTQAYKGLHALNPNGAAQMWVDHSSNNF